MPVPEQTPVSSYIGNGVATTFAYTYKIFAVGDLKVTVDGVLKTLTTDYTVTGAGQSGGGSVVFVNPPAVAAAVIIYRDIAFSRSTDYVEGGDLLAQTVDDDFDRAVMLMQQLKDDKNRALKLVKGETADQVISETPANRANKVIGFDALGALALKAIADLGGVYTIGDGLQLSGSDLKVAADVVRTALANQKLAFADLISDYVVSGLLGTDPGAVLAMTIPGGTAYVIGVRVVKSGSDADLTRTYTASKDTYVDISNAGAITYTEVANGAAAPSVAANSIRTQKVVTNGTEITSVTDLRVLVPKVAAHAKTIFANNYILAGTDTYTLDIPGYTAYSAGDIIFAKVTNANTVVAPTLNISALGAKTIKKDGSAALAAGDMPAGHEAIFRYNGTDMILLNPKNSVTVGYASTYAQGYRNAAQSIVDQTVTKVLIDTEVSDPGNNLDLTTSRYNVPSAGYYLINAKILFESPMGTLGDESKIYLYKNGASLRLFGRMLVASDVGGQPLTVIEYLTVGDYIELYCYQNNSANTARNLEVGSVGYCVLEIIRLW